MSLLLNTFLVCVQLLGTAGYLCFLLKRINSASLCWDTDRWRVSQCCHHLDVCWSQLVNYKNEIRFRIEPIWVSAGAVYFNLFTVTCVHRPLLVLCFILRGLDKQAYPLFHLVIIYHLLLLNIELMVCLTWCWHSARWSKVQAWEIMSPVLSRTKQRKKLRMCYATYCFFWLLFFFFFWWWHFKFHLHPDFQQFPLLDKEILRWILDAYCVGCRCWCGTSICVIAVVIGPDIWWSLWTREKLS